MRVQACGCLTVESPEPLASCVQSGENATQRTACASLAHTSTTAKSLICWTTLARPKILPELWGLAPHLLLVAFARAYMSSVSAIAQANMHGTWHSLQVARTKPSQIQLVSSCLSMSSCSGSLHDLASRGVFFQH